MEDDVFLPEGSELETEIYEESLQPVLDTLRYIYMLYVCQKAMKTSSNNKASVRWI